MGPADTERALRERLIGFGQVLVAQPVAARSAVTPQAIESGFDSGKVGQRSERLLGWLAQFARGRRLTVKTRTGLTSFGAGLKDDEVRYLHDASVAPFKDARRRVQLSTPPLWKLGVTKGGTPVIRRLPAPSIEPGVVACGTRWARSPGRPGTPT
jgi:hypothetical protein